MKKALAILALALWAPAVTMAQEIQQSTFYRNYDLDATTYTYCVTSTKTGSAPVKTSGSSTTITAYDSATAPFSPLAVGDELIFITDSLGTQARRILATKTSDISIVVNTAIDLGTTGKPFTYNHRVCGTTAADGWVNTGSLVDKMVKLDFVTLTGTGGVDVSIECRFQGDGGTVPIQVFAGNYSGTTAPTNGDVIPVMENCASVRVGIKWHTANVGTDSMSAYFLGNGRAH